LEVLGLKTVTKKLYEAMFLVDSAKAAADWDGVERSIKSMLERAEGEIVSIKRWDERMLAYEIDRQSRGTYVLCYFRGNGRKNPEVERNVQLSEQFLRVLILCADHIQPKDIEKDTPVMLAEKSELETEADRATKGPAEAERANAEAFQTAASSPSEMQEDVREISEEPKEEVKEGDEAVVAEAGPVSTDTDQSWQADDQDSDSNQADDQARENN
jgi:small subunit ribosomal protein S6